MLSGLTHEHITIPAGPRCLRACLSYNQAPRGIACLAGPHPLMGGSMQNNVIQSLCQALPTAGIATLCFDYPGFDAGAAADHDAQAQRHALIAEFWSDGRTHQDKDMVGDAATAWAWARANVPGVGLLVGYSFGAYAVHQLIEPAPDAVVLLCPTLDKHDFMPRMDGTPIGMLFGDRDFSCPVAAAEAFASLSRCARSQVVPGSDHFLRGYENLASDLCLSLARRLNEVTR